MNRYAKKIPVSLASLALASAFSFTSASPVQAELVSHWNFNDAAGSSTAVDSTGTYNAEASNSNITFGTDGKFGTAVTFDGTDGSQLQYSPLQGIYDTDLSFAFWVNYDAETPASSQIIGAWEKEHSHRIFFTGDANGTNNALALDLRYIKNGEVHTYSSGVSGLTPETWTHIAFTFDRTSGLLNSYVNGSLSRSNTIDGTYPLRESSGQHGMGLKQDGGAYSTNGVYSGSLDEMYVFSDALTLQQIRGLIYSNNISEFVPANPYQHSSEKILLGALFQAGASSLTVQEAMESGGTRGANAAETDPGIAKIIAGSGTTIGTTADITGNGLMVDLSSLGEGTGYSIGIQNAQVNHSPIRTTGKTFNESQTQGSVKVTQGFKVEEGIGIHASGLITFDLNELRESYGWEPNDRLAFISTAGQNDTGSGGMHQAILVSDANQQILGSYVNGKYVPIQDSNGTYTFDGSTIPAEINASNRLYEVNLPLPANAAYLTLAVLDRGNKTSDHGIFSQAHLQRIQTETVHLNRLFDDTGFDSATTNIGNLETAMSTNTIGAAPSLSSIGIDSLFNGVSASTKIASTADMVFDFTKNFSIKNGYSEARNSRCAEMASSHSSAALNPLLGTLDNPNDFIGMHSDYAMTFDLDEIRMAGGWNENQWFNFSTTLTGTHTSSKTVTGVLLLSSDEEILSAYVNGQLFDVVNEDGVWSLDGLSPDTPLTVTGSETAEFNVDLGADAKFLTLALLCAGDMNTDHAAWFNPTLTAIPTQDVPEPASWAILALGTCGLLFLRRRGGRSKN